MEEKIIIREKVTKERLIKLLIIIGIIVVLEVPVFFGSDWFRTEAISDIMSGLSSPVTSIYGFIANALEFIGVIGLAALAVLILCCIVTFTMSKCEIVVTSHRVYGCSWKQQVNLPIDMISAVKKGLFKSIVAATASDNITFPLLKQQNEIFDAISDLLNTRQQKTVESVAEKKPASSTDELREYKALLDAEIITQEEFDAKKKQLLGL